jgi:hypothetical protein
MTTGAAYVLAGGGTGGHLYPGLAVAAALCHAEPDAQVTFFTTTRALDRTLLERTAFTQFPQSVQPLTGRPWAWPGSARLAAQRRGSHYVFPRNATARRSRAGRLCRRAAGGCRAETGH